MPKEEWLAERDPERIARMLDESAKVVRDAISGWTGARLKGKSRVELDAAVIRVPAPSPAPATPPPPKPVFTEVGSRKSVITP